MSVSVSGGRPPAPPPALPQEGSGVVADLIYHTRIRTQLHRAEKRLTNQIKALERTGRGQEGIDTQSETAEPLADGDQFCDDTPKAAVAIDDESDGDHDAFDTHTKRGAADGEAGGSQEHDDVHSRIAPARFAAFLLLVHRNAIRKERTPQERIIVDLAHRLPVWPFVEKIRGLGPLGLGLIIGAAGDLFNYSNPAKLWKRMGLAVMDGKAQRRIKAVAGKGRTRRDKADEAVRHGYSPSRRSLMHNLGDALMKQNDGPYRQLYEERKVYELARLPDDCKTRLGWAHKRALRIVEKRLLRELWREWRATPSLTSTGEMPVTPARDSILLAGARVRK